MIISEAIMHFFFGSPPDDHDAYMIYFVAQIIVGFLFLIWILDVLRGFKKFF